jgi:hypothetical protein
VQRQRSDESEPSPGNFVDGTLPRWVRAYGWGFAHLDLGERSSNSLRLRSGHIIVAACRAHIGPEAAVFPESHQPRCSDCELIARNMKFPPTLLRPLR